MKTIRIARASFPIIIAGTLLAQDSQRATIAADAKAIARSAASPASAHSPTAGLVWLSDLEKAKAHAKAERKWILLFFHGSNWCPPCILMEKQVIGSPEFAQYARQSLVLVDVDFPADKSKQSDELRRANLALKAKFNLSPEWGEGFPTIVLLNEAGETAFQETGYAGGGPGEVLAKLRRHTDPGASSASFKNLTIDEFAQMAVDKANIILDVRTEQEFKAGHLPRAINLDVNAADFAVKAAALDKSKTYLVHCASGGRSVTACGTLAKLGFARLYNVPGGFRAWSRAGKPVER